MNVIEWRPIPDWPSYVINSDPEAPQVWSLPRRVPCKGGATRLARGMRINPTRDGRVPLSHGGKAQLLHVVRYLYPLTFPDHVEQQCRDGGQQVLCRRGHPLIDPQHELVAEWMITPSVTYWGTRNRVCLHCWRDAVQLDKGSYSLHYGMSRPTYSTLPAQPKLGAHKATNDGNVVGDSGYAGYRAYEAARWGLFD